MFQNVKTKQTKKRHAYKEYSSSPICCQMIKKCYRNLLIFYPYKYMDRDLLYARKYF